MKKALFVVVVALGIAGVATAAVSLTGYGATRRAWAAHHTADPNPKLAKGCCYLPRQADGTDRYYAVNRNGKGRVFSYGMHFAPRISTRSARSLLQRHELPADARFVRSKKGVTCLILLYRSAAAKRALGSATVGAALYSSADGLYTGKVQDMIVSKTTAQAC